MNRIFAISIGLASLCVSVATIQAQEKTPVAVDILADYSVATNPFSQNWEIALGIQGLSFYSNQENFNPGQAFLSNPNIATNNKEYMRTKICWIADTKRDSISSAR